MYVVERCWPPRTPIKIQDRPTGNIKIKQTKNPNVGKIARDTIAEVSKGTSNSGHFRLSEQHIDGCILTDKAYIYQDV